MIGNKIANKIKKNSKNLETVTNENYKEIPKQRYTSPEKRQIDDFIDEVIDDLRLK